MADYLAVTQSVRAFVRSGGRAYTDDLPDLASGYAQLCREANARLRRCVDYVRRGGLAEAAHLARCQPDLVRLVGELKFPEWGQWVDACATHGLQRPPPVADGIEEVREAVARHAMLAPLLARHRLLAVAKAPAAERLAVVRLLRTHDPDNPAWAAEALALEPAVLDELAGRVTKATRAGDAEAAARVLAEVEAARWESPLPDSLADDIDRLRGERERAAAAAELTELAARFGRAVPPGGDHDLESAAGRWAELLGRHPDVIPPAVSEQVDAEIARRRAESSGRRKREERELAGKLFKPEEAMVPATSGRGRAWIVMLGLLVLLLASGIAYFALHPETLHRIRGFIPI